MKPHLRMRFGVWACGQLAGDHPLLAGRMMKRPIGYGNSTDEAIGEFKRALSALAQACAA